jgi:hypothetical protein
MQRPRRDRKVFLALCANAAVLLLILLVLLERDNRLTLTSAALAEPQAPIAGGSNGLFVMPGQLSANSWGCYLMDTDHATLSVYQYSPSEPILRLVAVRSFEYDRQLSEFNTAPPPHEIKDLVDQNNQKMLQDLQKESRPVRP